MCTKLYVDTPRVILLLFCQPRVEVTSCFVYKVMGLTFHDRINTQLIYRFVVSSSGTSPQRIFLGSNLTGCSFFIHFFFILFSGGGGVCFIILFMTLFFSFYLFFFFFIFYPFNMYKAHTSNICNNTNYCKFENIREIINKDKT